MTVQSLILINPPLARAAFCSRIRYEFRSLQMTKKAAVAATAVVMTMSSFAAYAAETSTTTVGIQQPSPADMNKLTDMRVGIVKSALQMTPDQEKYWPAIEQAIRARAKNRQARWEKVAELHDSGSKEGPRRTQSDRAHATQSGSVRSARG
jgi:hypothetical protein